MPLLTLPPAPRSGVARPELARTDLGRTALDLAADVELWWPALRFSREERVHTRLYADEHLEAWLLTWMPGQGTEMHDHGGSAGALAVLSGWLHESVPGARGPVGRWLRPGSVQAFGPDHVHEVLNCTDSPAVSLHVYAPRLHTMTRYAVRDDTLEVAGVSRAGADW